MNWVEYVWPMLGGMSLTLGLVHLFIWGQQPNKHADLVLAVCAIAVSALSVLELMAMTAPTPQAHAEAARLAHVPLAVGLVALILFVRLRFRAGRVWLLVLFVALRLLAVAAGFVGDAPTDASRLMVRPMLLPGQAEVWAPAGDTYAWRLVAHLSLLVLLVYLVDVVREVRARGNVEEYRRAVEVCTSLAIFVLLAGGLALMVTLGVGRMPFLVNPAFLVAILVLSYELSGSVLRGDTLLRDDELRWELAGQIAGIAPWSCDLATGAMDLSRKARELFDVGDQNVVLADIVARVHPDDRDRMRRSIEQSIAGEERFEREYRLVLGDGHLRWIASRGRIERDGDGIALAMSGVAFDLTRIRQADALFRGVVEAAPSAILLVDGDGRIQLANARASIIFGYPADDLIGQSIDLLLPESLHDLHRAHHDGAAPGVRKRRAGHILVGRCRDGSAVPVEVELAPVEDRGVLAFVTDISERLRAERESSQQRNELAHLSRVATIGEMSASLAHELNQPLTAILSNSQAALHFLRDDGAGHVELRETLVDIADSGKRAGDVIRRLRAMLKKEDALPRPLDLNQVVNEVVQLYHSDFINRGVIVQLQLAPDLPSVLGDRVQLQQVLLNLVINACDAMAGGSVRRLTVTTRQLAGGEVGFAVRDLGTGISAERLERIFEPFETSKSEGMGLGLSVCRTLVRSHGGRLWAENNDDAGATFHVALPACLDA